MDPDDQEGPPTLSMQSYRSYSTSMDMVVYGAHTRGAKSPHVEDLLRPCCSGIWDRVLLLLVFFLGASFLDLTLAGSGCGENIYPGRDMCKLDGRRLYITDFPAVNPDSGLMWDYFIGSENEITHVSISSNEVEIFSLSNFQVVHRAVGITGWCNTIMTQSNER